MEHGKIDNRERIESRIHIVHVVFRSIARRWPGIRIDLYMLRHCVESYYYDVERMKSFHFIEFADEHKRAAYTMKWICRLRPVYFDSDKNRAKSSVLANEALAIALARRFLSLKKPFEEKFMLHLLYSLHFRSPDEDWLRAVAYLMQKSYK